MKIGILGEKKSVLAFSALGIQAFGVSSLEDLMVALQTIKNEQFAVLFITEEIASLYDKQIGFLFQGTLPACLVIPSLRSDSGATRKELEKILERALGSAQLLS